MLPIITKNPAVFFQFGKIRNEIADSRLLCRLCIEIFGIGKEK